MLNPGEVPDAIQPIYYLADRIGNLQDAAFRITGAGGERPPTRGYLQRVYFAIQDYRAQLDHIGQAIHGVIPLTDDPSVPREDQISNQICADLERLTSFFQPVVDDADNLKVVLEFFDDDDAMKRWMSLVLKFQDRRQKLLAIARDYRPFINLESDKRKQPPRFLIDVTNGFAELREEKFPLNSFQVHILVKLAEKKGGYVGGKELHTVAGSKERPDRAVGRLPAPIQELIERHQREGYRLKVAAEILK